jgi:class 3 adenylate cyclase
MFCDLVGSTALASRLDAEDWRNLVNAYLDEAAAAVAELGGYALKRLGDGLMALFGYPTAQENDAERAVRAALAIQRALGQLNRKNAGSGHPELVARIGVETGPVVVDSVGDIFGDAPNIAARVQALAEPGTCWSPPRCSVRWRACSSPRIVGSTRSRARPSRSRFTRSCGRAAQAGVPASVR